ncbi:MAG: T9SS type A sorting domain-containing protein, partial [Bacteroidota bacterium]
MRYNVKILILFLFLAGNLSAQDSLFIRSYGLIGYNYGEKIIQTADSGFILLGNKSGFVGNTDMYLIKVDKYGNYMWDKAYGYDEVNWAEDFVKTKDNGFVITGYMTVPENNNDYNIMLVKTDFAGNLQWMKNYGGSNWDLAHSLIETPDSGFIIAGETYSYGNGNNDIFFLKTDKNGDSVWMKTYGGLNTDIGYDINYCHDGNFIMTGVTNSFGHGGYDAYLMKLDNNGDSIWSRTYGDTLDDKAFAGIETFDHGIAITGSTNDFNAQGQDACILKIDSTGNKKWINTYGGPNDEEQYDIIEMPQKGFFSVGYTTSFGYVGSKEFYMIITDQDGWFITGPTYGGEDNDVAYSCINTLSGGLAIIGTTESMGLGISNILFLKSDSMGSTNINSYIHITDIDDNLSESQNISIFPNPASDNITISYDSNLKLNNIMILDLIGQPIKSIHPEPGTNTTIDLSDLPNGIFLIVIKEDN